MHRSACTVQRLQPARSPDLLDILRAALPHLELTALIVALSLFWGFILFSALPA